MCKLTEENDVNVGFERQRVYCPSASVDSAVSHGSVPDRQHNIVRVEFLHFDVSGS